MSDAELPGDYRAELDRLRHRLGALAIETYYFSTVGSTNDVAASLAGSVADGTVVLAEEQTAGRGRRGRAWISPAGAGLYASIICRAEPASLPSGMPRTALMTIMAGVAIANAIRTCTSLNATIKWPNDVQIGGRKVAGILAEACDPQPSAFSPVAAHVILGFGINVGRVVQPIVLPSHATSLELELGREVDRATLFAESLAALADGQAALAAGRFDVILGRWRELAQSSLGRVVEWLTVQGPRRGEAAGIDEDGALLVRTGPGVERVVGGEVRWL